MASVEYKLRNLLTEIEVIREIGEGNAKPFQFLKRSPLKYTFMARLGQNKKEEVRVDFEDLKNDTSFKNKLLQNVFDKVETIFNVGFKVNEDEFQFQKGEMGVFLRIMSTISLIIQDFVNENSPDLIYVTGSPREFGSEDEVKNRLYKVFIFKQLDKISNYSAEARLDGYVIYKNGYKGSAKKQSK